MNNEAVFQLTLGPVQGFVSQARRTRDFWAGSFILSWLSGVAMTEVIEQGGEIDFPRPDSNFMAAIRGELDNAQPLPAHGALPNRFKAIHARVGSEFDPVRVIDSLRAAWRELAELVWNSALQATLASLDATQQQTTRAIWERQVEGFWETSWCLSPADEASDDLLQRRKNLRQHLLPDEPGVKCMMMDGFQELSGTASPNAASLNDFWSAVRDDLNVSDLRPGEHLCAPALIKRLFARYFDRLEVPMAGWTLCGWELPTRVPSLPYLAAAHWIEQAVNAAAARPEVAGAWQALVEAARLARADEGLNERGNPLRCLAQAAAAHPPARPWTALDGNLYFPRLPGYSALYGGDRQADRAAQAFDHLRAAARLPEPTPFYAVLIMDGDQLGAQMGDKTKQAGISDALNRFTDSAAGVVEAHNGFLVYAGGDDVLALLPLEDALPCAAALRTGYEAAFAAVNSKRQRPIETSISAGVLFSHIKQPLTTTLQRSHALLDEVAKNRSGRDSLAVEVWKPGGRHLQWAMPWASCGPAGEPPLLAQWAQRWQGKDGVEFTHGFLKRIIELLERLGTSDIDDAVCLALLQAEYRHSKLPQEGEAELLSGLLEQARRCRRSGGPAGIAFLPGYQTDSFKLLRFLAQKGVQPVDHID